MSDKNNDSGEKGGRPATAEEQANIQGIMEMLRQQNLNVTSVDLPQHQQSVAANVIPDNDNASARLGADDGRKKHAFWDTQVRLPIAMNNVNNNAVSLSFIHAEL